MVDFSVTYEIYAIDYHCIPIQTLETGEMTIQANSASEAESLVKDSIISDDKYGPMIEVEVNASQL